MTAQVVLDGVDTGVGDRDILVDVSHAFKPGCVTGLIGENGAGKSTLLRVILGRVVPSRGSVTVIAPDGIGYLPQESDIARRTETVQEFYENALAASRRDAARLSELERLMGQQASAPRVVLDEIMVEYADLQSKFELNGGYTVDSRIAEAAGVLGVEHIDRRRPMNELSGGQQARVRLVGVTIGNPDVLILDEPTNHLDAGATEWLEQQLRARTGMTILVTHDRVLLDRVADTLVELDGDTHRLSVYGNGYGGYLHEKAAERTRQIADRLQWERDRAATVESLQVNARVVGHERPMRDRNKAGYNQAGGRVQAAVSSRVRSARRQLEEIDAHEPTLPPDPLVFSGIPNLTGGSEQPILEVDQVAVTGRLRPTTFTVAQGEQLLITGRNGAGKTTLLDVIAGLVRPDGGHVAADPTLGYLRQIAPVVDGRRTVLQHFIDDTALTEDEGLPKLLAVGLLPPTSINVPVVELSVGQRRRLELARLMLRPTNLLILDEPSNHLSLRLVEEIEQALDNYLGGVVVATHDRGLLQRWTGRRLDIQGE